MIKTFGSLILSLLHQMLNDIKIKLNRAFILCQKCSKRFTFGYLSQLPGEHYKGAVIITRHFSILPIARYSREEIAFPKDSTST